MDNTTYNNQNFENPRKPFSIASLVCGILSLVALCCYFLSPILGILAIIFAIVSRHNKRFDGIAIAGLVTGIVGFIFGTALFAYALWLMSHPEFIEEMNNMLESMEAELESATQAVNMWFRR